MIVYIQPPNIYFEIAAYIHAEGMYGCVTHYLVCTVYEVLEYMSVLHETFVTRLTHYPVCPLPGSSGTRHVRITHPARQPGTSGFRYAPSSKRPCTVNSHFLKLLHRPFKGQCHKNNCGERKKTIKGPFLRPPET